jgi:hypothetical protein
MFKKHIVVSLVLIFVWFQDGSQGNLQDKSSGQSKSPCSSTDIVYIRYNKILTLEEH